MAFITTSQFFGSAIYVTCALTLSVAVWRESHSLWAYATNGFIAAAATAALGPVMGHLADRIGRIRLVLGMSATLAAGAVVASLTYEPRLPVPWCGTITALGCGMASALVVSAVSLPRLIAAEAKGSLARSLGAVQIAEQSARVIAPLVLLAPHPLDPRGVFVVLGLLAAAQGMATLLLGRAVGERERAATRTRQSAQPRQRLVDLWRLAASKPLLLIFAPYLAVSTACVELSTALLIPVTLSYASDAALGAAMAAANGAAVLGGIAVTRMPRRWTIGQSLRVFLAIEGMGSLFLAIEALTDSIWVFGVAMTVGFFILPISLVAAQVVWLGDAPADQQGRLTGLERLSSWLLVPLAMALGPLVAQPLTGSARGVDIGVLRALAAGGAAALLASTVITWRLTRAFHVPLRSDVTPA